jgi:hypothetical protein
MIKAGWRPARGRCFVHLDPLPGRIGRVHIPDSARELRITNTAHSGRVLATAFKDEEYISGEPEVDAEFTPFAVGDRVFLLLRDDDRDKEVIITSNETVLAIIEESQ